MIIHRAMLLCAMLIPWCGLLAEDAKPIELARGSGINGPKQPQAHVAADGMVDVVHSVGDEIRLSTSKDHGATFAPAASTIRCPNLSSGMRRGPRIVRTQSALVVTAIGGKQGKGRDGDLMAWHSTDDGETWSEGVPVNDAPDAAREGLHAMCLGPKGEIWCAWLDLRHGKTEVYAAVSRDDGRTWEQNIQVYRSPDGSVCECCHPSICIMRGGGMNFLFRNSLRGQRDMYLVDSGDGKNFSSGRKLGKGGWKLDRCPMDGGMLASDAKGRLVTVWRRENQIFTTVGDGTAEKPLGPGEQPWVACTSAGPIFVWTRDRERQLQMQVGLNRTAQTIAPNARDPVVAAHLQADFAIVCWEDRRDGVTRVVAQSFPLERNSAGR